MNPTGPQLEPKALPLLAQGKPFWPCRPWVSSVPRLEPRQQWPQGRERARSLVPVEMEETTQAGVSGRWPQAFRIARTHPPAYALTSSRGEKAASCLILVVWWWLHFRHSSTWLLTHCCGCVGSRGLGALLTTWFRCSMYCAGIGLL
jgi:hypothetical protein